MIKKRCYIEFMGRASEDTKVVVESMKQRGELKDPVVLNDVCIKTHTMAMFISICDRLDELGGK